MDGLRDVMKRHGEIISHLEVTVGSMTVAIWMNGVACLFSAGLAVKRWMES